MSTHRIIVLVCWTCRESAASVEGSTEALTDKEAQVGVSLSYFIFHYISQANYPYWTGTAAVYTKSKCVCNRSGIMAPSAICQLSQTRCCRLCRNSILKQPGPVEAMKQMLFRLQAVEAELQRQEQASVRPTLTDRLQTETEETPVKWVWTGTPQVIKLTGSAVSKATSHDSQDRISCVE